MYRKNNIVYINQGSLKGIANRWFGGDKNRAKEALLSYYGGRTIRFQESGGLHDCFYS
jgi:hypothetical protein